MPQVTESVRRIDGVELIAEESRIPSGTEGIELFVRSRHRRLSRSIPPRKRS